MQPHNLHFYWQLWKIPGWWILSCDSNHRNASQWGMERSSSSRPGPSPRNFHRCDLPNCSWIASVQKSWKLIETPEFACLYLFVSVCNINKLDVFAANYSANESLNDHPFGDKAPISVTWTSLYAPLCTSIDLIDLDCILSHVPIIDKISMV